jgi:uncharacterized protein YecE (DUF72 family)
VRQQALDSHRAAELSTMAVHIGTSGWSYDEWVNVLYPRKASSLERLDAYARHFGTVEVNRTFYGWPTE